MGLRLKRAALRVRARTLRRILDLRRDACLSWNARRDADLIGEVERNALWRACMERARERVRERARRAEGWHARRKEWASAEMQRALFCCELRLVTTRVEQQWHECRVCTLGAREGQCTCYPYDVLVFTRTCGTCGDVYRERAFPEGNTRQRREPRRPLPPLCRETRWARRFPALHHAYARDVAEWQEACRQLRDCE